MYRGKNLIHWEAQSSVFQWYLWCTTDTIADFTGPPVSIAHFENFRSSTFRTAGDQATHPEHPALLEALIKRANEDQRPLLQELVSFVGQ